MGDPGYSVVVFRSTSGAIRAEKLAKEAGMAVKLIPVPRRLSSACGLCLRFESPDTDRVRSLLDGERVEFEGISTL